EHPKTILQRRVTNETVFGNVLDLSNDKNGFVQSMDLDGSLEKGFAALTVHTRDGEDVCFASYRPGTYRTGTVETDALQAFVRRGPGGVTGLILAGGKSLRAGKSAISLGEPGLVILEQVDTGAFLLANLSPKKNTLTLTLPELAGREQFAIDEKGRRSGTGKPANTTLELEPGQRVEFATPGTKSIFESRTAMLRLRQQQQEAALKAVHDAAAARSEARVHEAAAQPAPAGTFLVVQAESFKAQGGGVVNVTSKKIGALGDSLSGWNGEGHWFEWEIDAPADGFYNLSLTYCTEANNSEREIQVNGEVQEPFAPVILPTTSGYSNRSDDWRMITVEDPITKKPLLIKLNKGKNTLRLTNTNNLAGNIDYLVVSSPDVKPTREKAANP
ncbi:MAG: hypothetical protein ACK5MR_12710, partial [Cumulibacter sp.]